MASAATFEDICAVCLDTRPLKIVGRCKHRFCEECLTITLESQGGDVFACPTCEVDCPRPWDGVKGMVNFTGEDVAVIDTVVVEAMPKSVSGTKELQETDKGKAGAEPQSSEGRGEEKRKKTKGKLAASRVDVECTICHHEKKEAQAVDLCVECGNLYICKECTKVHARNKATKRHVVVRLRSETKKEEALCEEHDSPLNSFCHDCGEAVCMVCVMLAHGQHKVEKLVDVVDEKVNELKVILENKQKRLGKLKDLKKDLALLKLMVPFVDRQDILIKEIEDHAQKYIEQITKWKEGLKDQVKEEYTVIKEIPVGFEKVSEMVKELQDPTERAGRLLTKTVYDREYLGKLIALHDEMEALVVEDGDIAGKGYREQLHELRKKRHTFFPEEICVSFGRLKCAEEEKGGGGGGGEGEEEEDDHDDYREVFCKTMQAVSEDMFIPSVANLGQMFAVAHPTRLGDPSTAIDIYELPGTLKHTLRDHVPPLYDMSSTPDGKLAVLSNGTGGGTGCSVKLFNPDTGYVSSTRDIDIAEPLSLGVTLQHQYVILGRNKQGQRVITVVDQSGAVQQTLKIDRDFILKDSDKEQSDSDSHVESDEIHKGTKSDSDAEVMDQESFNECDSEVDTDSYTDTDADSIVAVDNPKRIAYGGRFIFVTGDKTVAVYEITDTGIHACKIIELTDCCKYTDISATVWDDFFVTSVAYDCVWLQEQVMDQESKCEWDARLWRHMFDAKFGDKRPTRVSIRDRHAVVCQGQSIRVFEFKK